MVNMKGRWCLITGAARGIGYLSAKFMAEQGANLILHSRKLAHTEKALAEVRALGVEAYAVEAELSDLDSVRAMLAEIDARGTQVDVVLNNAGMQIAYRVDYLATPVEDYTESFKVNTIAPMMITSGTRKVHSVLLYSFSSVVPAVFCSHRMNTPKAPAPMT